MSKKKNMTNKMIQTKHYFSLLISVIFISISSCSSNDSIDMNENSFSKLIIGKWAWTNQDLTSKCAGYREFKSNGTLTYYQNLCGTPEIDNLTYKIEGDQLLINGGDNIETIISITNTTMSTSFSQGSALPTGYGTYIKIE